MSTTVKADLFNGKRLTLRRFERGIDKWAALLNIQKLRSIKSSGKEYRIVNFTALREAGERHYDLNGGDGGAGRAGKR